MIATDHDIQRLVKKAHNMGYKLLENTSNMEYPNEPFIANNITFEGKLYSEEKMKKLLGEIKEPEQEKQT